MLTGALAGLAHNGYHPIYVHARAEFSLLAFEHMVNTIAKWPWLHDGEPLPIIIRMLVGRGWGQGPTHSQSFHTMLSQVPGLDVVYPTGHDLLRDQYKFTKGMEPRIVFEPRRLYDMVWDYSALWGFRSKSDVRINPVGDTVLEAGEASQQLHARFGVIASVEPIQRDYESTPHYIPEGQTPHVLVDSTPKKKTNYGMGSPGVMDLHPPFTPTPTAHRLEQDWYVSVEEIVEAACILVGAKYTPPEEVTAPAERDGRKEAF
jgi:hypothetical protein